MISYDLYKSLISILASYKHCLSPPRKVDGALINRPLRFINTAIDHCNLGCSSISPVTALISAGDRKKRSSSAKWLSGSTFNPQVSAVESLEGPLLQVEGLGDLRLELHSKKLNIHLVLIDELHRHLYIKSTSRLGHKNRDKNAARPPG